MKKILRIEELTKKINILKKRNKKIVLCHGVFDLLHIGHLNHFKSAKKFGDILIVSITDDFFVNKGPGRPVFNSQQRSEIIEAIKFVDFVIVNKNKVASNIIKQIKPHIYCKGLDYKAVSKDFTLQIKDEMRVAKQYNCLVKFTSDKLYSSSEILNSSNLVHSDVQALFIRHLKKKFTFEDISRLINSIKKKILVIGEIIIDEYVFTKALGKSGKESVLTFQNLKKEKFLGGSGAIANHLGDFCNKISIYGMVGDTKNNINFIKKKIKKNVNLMFFKKYNSPTIVKRKYLDYDGRKVFSTYHINDDLVDGKQNLQIKNFLKKNIKKYDLIIVSDYGHGFLSDDTSKLITRESKFLAVNCQINSSNSNFHSLHKYKNFDLLIINEAELRNEFKDRSSNLEELVKKLSKDYFIKKCIVTRGSQGALLYDYKSKHFISCPAFASKIVDKVGAGDAMLSVAALLLSNHLPDDLVLMLSSLAAAQSVENLSNSKSINKINLLKHMSHLLK